MEIFFRRRVKAGWLFIIMERFSAGSKPDNPWTLGISFRVPDRKLKPRSFPPIGWREWVRLPDLGISLIKAKVDTGARSSALHAFKIKEVHEGPRTFVSFKVHPYQRDAQTTLNCKAELLEYREVRSSHGHVTLRPVVVTSIQFMDQIWPIELTLISRDNMGFRMLLGREAVRGRFFVDAGHSFYGGHPERAKKMKRKNDSRRGDE